MHTDKKTFSAPVDLGASIITGIEADVVGERQPDPSALVCKQLGTECVPLGQLCPLYDVVTGALVTPEVDTALEAEFNALLDDTVGSGVCVEQVESWYTSVSENVSLKKDVGKILAARYWNRGLGAQLL